MAIISLFQAFDIAVYELSEWTFGHHKHSFFEIFYIVNGQGIHQINDNQYPYSDNDIFLLTPADEHSLLIQQTTQICVISFNKIYFSKNHNHNSLDFSELFKQIEYILSHSNYLKPRLFNTPYEKELIQHTIMVLQAEYQNKKGYYELIIQNQIFLVLTLIARKINENIIAPIAQLPQADFILEVIRYIQDNIYNNDSLKIEYIAKHFCKSANSLTNQFKTNTGTTIKNFILDFRLNIVKQRLINGNFTISELAHQLGFTDESHLNKMFKNRYNISPKAYKQQHNPQHFH